MTLEILASQGASQAASQVGSQAGRAEPIPMARATVPDPLMRELFQGDTPRKAWVAATPCAHLWQAPLPNGLGAGAHLLLVRARDEYGREHTARTVIEVTPAEA